jgi:hypothetical protein
MAGSTKFGVVWGDGLQIPLNKLKNRPEAMRRAIAPAVYMEAEETMSASKPRVPVDHGNLVNSGHVQNPQFEGDSVSVEFGYGGVAGSGNQGETNVLDVGYAVPVHENLEKHHPHGQAKYLEQPLRERESGMSERLAGRIQERLPK